VSVDPDDEDGNEETNMQRFFNLGDPEDEDDGIQLDIRIPDEPLDDNDDAIGDIEQQQEEQQQQRDWDNNFDVDPEGDPDVDVGEDVESDRDDEEKTIYLRPPRERQQIELELRDLMHTVPRIADDYVLLDRLGEGQS